MNTLTAGLVSFLGAGSLIGLVTWLAYKSGKTHVINENNEAAKEVANEQTKIAVNRPSKSDIVERLRKHNF